MSQKKRQKRKKRRSSANDNFDRLRAWEEAYGEKWKQQDVHSFGIDKREIYVVI